MEIRVGRASQIIAWWVPLLNAGSMPLAFAGFGEIHSEVLGVREALEWDLETTGHLVNRRVLVLVMFSLVSS